MMNIAPLTPTIGAEISGVNFSRPLGQAVLDGIYAALMEHLVIFFDVPDLTPDAHLAFAESFGELDKPHPVYPSIDGFPQIVLLENGPEHPPDTNEWHTDLTFQESPPFASILFAEEVPAVGGDTMWSNMFAAYDALPSEMQERVCRLSAVHDMGSFRNNYVQGDDGVAALNDAMRKLGSAVHPVAPKHPVTGRRMLFVNQSFTRMIVGMTMGESDNLLQSLYHHINCPEFQVRFRWRPGMMAMWDNRATQHYAVADYSPHYRRMRRITVVADRRVG